MNKKCKQSYLSLLLNLGQLFSSLLFSDSNKISVCQQQFFSLITFLSFPCIFLSFFITFFCLKILSGNQESTLCSTVALRCTAVITTTQLHSIQLQLRFRAVSNPVHDVSEVWDSEKLWQWFRLVTRFKVFFRWTILQ